MTTAPRALLPLCATAALMLPTSVAAAECAALDAARLASLVASGEELLFGGDLPGLDAVDQAIAADAPCMATVVDPKVWARYLVTRSVVAYNTHGDWQASLEAAVRADPTVSRVVGAEHPIATWSPPAVAPAPAPRAPDGVVLFLDGRRIQYMEGLHGPHFLQAQAGAALASAYARVEGGTAAWDGVVAQVAPASAVATADSDAGGGRTGPVAEGPRERHPGRALWIVAGSSALASGGLYALAARGAATYPTADYGEEEALRARTNGLVVASGGVGIVAVGATVGAAFRTEW